MRPNNSRGSGEAVGSRRDNQVEGRFLGGYCAATMEHRHRNRRALAAGRAVLLALTLALASAASPRAQEIQRWSGAFAEERDPTTVLAQSLDWWATIWRMADRHPPVAFDEAHETAIGIFLGRRPTGGYRVEIPFMGPRNGKFIVEVKEAPPPPGSITTQAVTTPWLIVLLATPALPVVIKPGFAALALPRRPSP